MDLQGQAAYGMNYPRNFRRAVLGIPQDYKEAVKWYRLAADQGYASAQFLLGTMYFNGQGVPQDYKEAVKWYRLAAEQGDSSAQFNLGFMYNNGQGVTQNYQEAAKLFRRAADQGDAKAQNFLGVMYQHGVGVVLNSIIAYAMYNTSATNDTTINSAINSRSKLSKSMTENEIAIAQDLTRQLLIPGKFLTNLDKFTYSKH